jgi:hypothetical protein
MRLLHESVILNLFMRMLHHNDLIVYENVTWLWSVIVCENVTSQCCKIVYENVTSHNDL